MRQFNKSDTSNWAFRYGPGSKGSKSFSGGTIGSSDGAYYSSLAGTSGAFTATVSNLADGTYNLPCVLIQMIGSIPSPDNWELNFLISVSGGVGTFLYPLQNNYGQSGNIAQIVTANDYSDITLTGSLSCPAWNGSYGGIGFLCGGNSISGSGGLNAVGLGFRGGTSAGTGIGSAGEGTGNSWNWQITANGNGGGGGGAGTDSGHVEAGNSAGGGNRTIGSNGSTRNTGSGGIGGSAISTQDGKALVPGGGSGQGGGDFNSGSGGISGVAGSGVWITIAKLQNWSGGVAIQGQNGNNASGAQKSGASGAGAPGCWVAKGQVIQVTGSINVTAGVGGTESGNFGGTGGNSGEGVTHIDYSAQTTAGVDSTVDSILADTGGAIFALL